MYPADLVFLNGNVITVNGRNDLAEAAAVSGNRICMVGSSEEARALIGEGTTVVDLHGRTLLPGFIDAHIHLTLLALLAGEYLDINSDELRTIMNRLSGIRGVVEVLRAGRRSNIRRLNPGKKEETV